MDNSREPNRKSLRSTIDEQENTPPSTMSKAASDELLSFFKSEFEKKLKDMGILEHKLQKVQNHAAKIEAENVQLKEIIQKQKAEEEAKKSLEPLVLKKLVKLKEGILWHGYSTLDLDEEPIQIFLIDSEYLHINGVIFGPAKKLVLDGLLSTFDADPFEADDPVGFEENDEIISNLLKRVHFCNLTDLYVAEQILSLNEYEKLASSGTIKNLYFDASVDKNAFITFENILQKLPNVEKLEMDVELTKESFKTLNKLVKFKMLQIFKLTWIDYVDFDADSFLVFMENHPNTHFTLSFWSDSEAKNEEVIKAELVILKQKLLTDCPTPGKLEVKFE